MNIFCGWHLSDSCLYAVYNLHLCSRIPWLHEMKLLRKLLKHLYARDFKFMSEPSRTDTVCWVQLWNRVAVRPHITRATCGEHPHGDRLTVETMSRSAVRGLRSPSAFFSRMPPRLNYTPGAWGWDGECQWFQTSAITTFGCSLWLTESQLFLLFTATHCCPVSRIWSFTRTSGVRKK